ncbi:MAG: nuclear transport factor 2 family protein [Thermoleophilia bacterium]|nr:nuclear transport factor 2 family protein [Thermoleophilia bacterium]
MTPEQDDNQAVREVLERYVDATFRADVEAVRQTFHPGASMAGYLGDQLLVGTPEPFLTDVGSRPSMAESDAPYRAEISSIEVSGRAASATLTESGFFGVMSFVNYFTLLETEGDWKIISKTFTSL